MSTYYVEVRIYPHGDMFAHTHFTSKARTAKGILRAASKALSARGYRTFEEPTAKDVFVVIGTKNGSLVSVDTYQRYGLFS